MQLETVLCILSEKRQMCDFDALKSLTSLTHSWGTSEGSLGSISQNCSAHAQVFCQCLCILIELSIISLLYFTELTLKFAWFCLINREAGLAGERREPVTATVAMVHSIPELIISEEVCIVMGMPSTYGYRNRSRFITTSANCVSGDLL